MGNENLQQTDEIPSEALLRERLDFLYSQTPITLAAHISAATVVSFLLWPVVGSVWAAFWLLAVYGTNLWRFLIARAYRRESAAGDARAAYHWRRLLIGVMYTTATWVVGAFIMFPSESLPHQTVYIVIVTAMVAGGVPVLAADRLLYLIFSAGMMLPLAVRLLEQGDMIHIGLGIMSVVYLGIMLRAGRVFRSFFDESITLRLRLQTLAETDPLTQLANRRRFSEDLQREWRRASRDSHPLSLLLIDVDYFKAYNDHYGHRSGDECLATIGQMLRNAAQRGGDLPARIGGEEFVLLLPGTTPEDALHVAESLRLAIYARNIPHVGSTATPRVTISVGVAGTWYTEKMSVDCLMEAADRALYTAKEEGRNRCKLAQLPADLDCTKISTPTAD